MRYLTPKYGIHRVYPENTGLHEGPNSVVAHVEGGVLTVIVRAADVVTSGPNPDRVVRVTTLKRPTGGKTMLPIGCIRARMLAFLGDPVPIDDSCGA